MAEEAKMKRQTNDVGPVGRQVGANIRRFRTSRGISTTVLSRILGELGRPIQATGITKIEKGERRVDVDDLVALSLALWVNPSALLFPPTVSGETVLLDDDEFPALPNDVVWQWADGLTPLWHFEGKDPKEMALGFRLRVRPEGDKKLDAPVFETAATYIREPDDGMGD